MLNRHLILFAIVSLAIFTSLNGQIVDHRPYQSPVRNQAGRGTCTAFAVVGAMETYDGVPVDLSEQYIYAWAKMENWERMKENYGEGANLDFYIQVLKSFGTVTEERMPYDPYKPIWEEDVEAFDRMKEDIRGSIFDLLSFEKYSYKLDQELFLFRQGDAARDIAWIKSQLDNGVKAIPAGYAVDADYWFAHKGDSQNKIDPSDFLRVQIDGKLYDYRVAQLLNNNLNEDIVAGKLLVGYSNPDWKITEGHAVSIVGYDETGFLIKNSWGTIWGDDGYGWVSYDYHKIWCDELLVIQSVVMDYPADNFLGAYDQFALKVRPNDYVNSTLGFEMHDAQFSLVWKGQEAPPSVKEVEYKCFDSNGNLVQTVYGLTQGVWMKGGAYGFPAHALDGKLKLGLESFTIEVKVTTRRDKVVTKKFRITGRNCREYVALP